ncbi:hypothetical protein [Edaphobacter albus]|uniref:hypothetical protein n=1 Tax=Edaphobacter sp. 4G125 TaxID=2763071 RepID=UPI001646BC18|nr:hypothetical protein [Edaphobacter sp. 4G125]QNI37645.1 hypothetical protein H7846_04980 [Edaphobacter sp. 4G125]
MKTSLLMIRCIGLLSAAALASTMALAQQPTPVTSQASQAQLESIAAQLSAAEDHLKQSQQEIDHLRDQINALRGQLAAANAVPTTPPAEAAVTPASSPAPDARDQIAMMQSEIEQHEQIKVESASKYPLRLTGLLLFNTFSNHGAVDNFDQPTIAVPLAPDTPSTAFGASLRQTIIGVQAYGPHLAGASSYAEINMDFYGGLQYSNYGSTGGLAHMRTAVARLMWKNDTAEVGLVEPLISPLSPTSYASVAEPAMAWAGNLWTWAPQLRYEHRFDMSSRGNLSWEFGLWDPPAAGYTNADIYRVPSAGERSGQPAYESRIAFNRHEQNTFGQLQFGIGGYYSRQAYNGGRNGDSYAISGDWKFPVTHHFELSGEAYRGRALGGLGGGVYKNVVAGNDPLTGASTFRLLNDAGGWTQAKLRFTSVLEANGAFGLDNGFSRDFHSIIIPSTASAVQLRARNQMWSANLIYSPKTYLILSPEFRHIRTFNINSSSSSADIFTLSLGYRF